MTIITGRALVVLAVFLSTAWLTAHHSFTAVFDASKKVSLTGTLAKVDWRNPHIEISLDVKGERGQVEAWVVEGGPPSFFTRSKISRSDFEKAVGQTVTLELYRARDGNLLGTLLKITFADGKSLTSDPGA